MNLNEVKELYIKQKKELAELFGLETRNKYEISDKNKKPILYVAEQQKGFMGLIFRQILGHWRTFEIHVFKTDRSLFIRAIHPFRFFFQRLDVLDQHDNLLGSIQQRFAIFSKKFDVLDHHGKVLLRVSSPIWKIWTFPFFNQFKIEAARIEKKWSGLLKEAFTDADNFRLEFIDQNLTDDQRKILIASSIFIDLIYFEKKANSN